MKVNHKYIIVILPAISIVLLALSLFVPYLSALALAPLFYLFDYHNEHVISRYRLFLSVTTVMVVTFISWALYYSGVSDRVQLVGAVVHGVVLSFSIILFWFTDRQSKNRLGYFTVIIYWLAFEYLLIKISPDFTRFLLGGLFDGYANFVSWNAYTGILGVSLWLLFSNVLIYYTLCNDHALVNGRVRWLSLSYTILFFLLPYLITKLFDLEWTHITTEDANHIYAGQANAVMNGIYTLRTEWIGRSASWVTVLLIIYSLVKQKVQ